MVSRISSQNVPPPYTPPGGSWYAAPPLAYNANPNGYMGWVPSSTIFTHPPPPNTVFITDAPPPYPGINGTASCINQAAENTTYGAWCAPVPGTEELPPSYDAATKKE